LIWNGGRLNTTEYPQVTYDKVFTYYRTVPNFHLRHVCTNVLIDEELAKDEKCNDLIKNYTTQDDYIIINSAPLYKHLLQFFPKDHFIWSTTLGIQDPEVINELSKNNMFVVTYYHNNNDNYLRQLTHPENLELIVAESCANPHCPSQMNHYMGLSKAQLGLPLSKGEFVNCPYQFHFPNDSTPQFEFKIRMKLPHAIDNNRIEELAAMGIHHFKISARFTQPDLFFWIVTYYLFLPEYREQAYKELLITNEKNLFKDKLKNKQFENIKNI